MEDEKNKLKSVHIEPLDIDGAEYCIKRLLDLNTEEVAKDEKSQTIIDDCVRNVAQYLTSIVEKQKKRSEIVDRVFKKLFYYSCEGIRPNGDGTCTYLHSDEYMDEHPDEQMEYKTVGNINNIDKTKTMDIQNFDIQGIEPVDKPSGPIYHMVKANKIGLTFSCEEELNGYVMTPRWVSIADYYTDINSVSTNRLYLNAVLSKKITYFGKPTKITNILTNQEVIDFVNHFNEVKPDSITFTEYDTNDAPVLETVYKNPHILTVNFCQLSTDRNEDEHKSLQFTITFDEMENRPAK